MEEDPKVESETAKIYLANIKSNYQLYLNEQLKQYISKEQALAENENQIVTTDNSAFRAQKDKAFAIDKNEFVSLISDALKIQTITFTEKAKLYELWSTFKEFNKDILIAILDDIKSKSSDFNLNFLYYLSEIKKQYESQLASLKESGGKVNE
ncbi:hypothetical protein CLORY_45670 [Clostridium oryzae]|uniref:Uncharacterized protein n=1 Tax=Clostridium oryzae TaxID=1450648 RepID=A0A1V4I3V9_9CLOT|nr:hypothetical protein CLORY_45670 [Clostridium oryzae]